MTRHVLLRCFVPIAGRMPWLCYRLAWVAGWAAWVARPGLRGTLTSNLLPFCDGDRRRAREAARAVCRNAASYWVDLATLPYRDLQGFERDHLRVTHDGRTWPLRGCGPVLIVSGHAGNPDLALQAVTARGRQYLALVEPLEPPAFAALMEALRTAGGGRYRETGVGGLRACFEALRAGGVVAILADRDLQGNGVCVPFGGRLVRMPRGPWDLARRTGATVLPIFAARHGADDFDITVEEPFTVPKTLDRDADLAGGASRFAGMLEAHIRRDPGQWAVLEDFWKAHCCGES